MVYGDSAGRARTTAASRSDYAILSLIGFRAQDVPAANPPVKDRVAAVNRMLREDRITIHPRCATLIRDLERVRWKEGAMGVIDKSDSRLTHASDALGYFIHRVFSLQARPPGSMRVSEFLR